MCRTTRGPASRNPGSASSNRYAYEYRQNAPRHCRGNIGLSPHRPRCRNASCREARKGERGTCRIRALPRSSSVGSGTSQRSKSQSHLVLVGIVHVPKSIINGQFLAAGSDQGILGGIAIAIGLSIINVWVIGALGGLVYVLRTVAEFGSSYPARCSS